MKFTCLHEKSDTIVYALLSISDGSWFVMCGYNNGTIRKCMGRMMSFSKI